METLYLLNTHSPFCPPLASIITALLFVSMNWTILGTSHKWNIQCLSFSVWQFHLAHKHLLGLLSLHSVHSESSVMSSFTMTSHLFLSLNFSLSKLPNKCHKVYWALLHSILHKKNLLETCFVGVPQTQRGKVPISQPGMQSMDFTCVSRQTSAHPHGKLHASSKQELLLPCKAHLGIFCLSPHLLFSCLYR